MGMAAVFDLAEMGKVMAEKREAVHRAARPAAQAGAQVIYEQARLNASTLRSKKEHYFYGTAAKNAPPGQKRAFAYGPFVPGSLYSSIYQAYSKDNSGPTLVTYHISWNAKKAPYGGMVEVGTSRAAAHAFIGPAIVSKRGDAEQAVKTKFVELVSAA